MSQCVHAEGASVREYHSGQWEEGKQVYLCFPESTPYQLDHLGTESPLSTERSLSLERIGYVIEVAQNEWLAANSVAESRGDSGQVVTCYKSRYRSGNLYTPLSIRTNM